MFLILFLVGTVVMPSYAFLEHWFISDMDNCTKDEFACLDGRCIPQRLRCDGVNDCKDDSDEEDCGLFNCQPPEYFRCKNQRCISSAFVCNEENDCDDFSDEVDCESFKKILSNNSTCDSGMWQCTDKLCVPEEWVCNGETDCLDGSDEGIGCSTNIKCDGFKCKNKHCVPVEWRCDGNDDCHDNSDEQDCENYVNPSKCTWDRHQFLCSNNRSCINLKEVCDGKPHCPDGSDEGLLCKTSAISCSTYNCSHQCLPLPTGPKCICPPGYHLLDEKHCEEINECKQYGICDQKCKNKVGSYECYCDPKYILQDDKSTCKAVGAEALMIFSSKAEIRGYLLNSNAYYPIARNLKQVVGVDFDGEHIFWTEIFSGHESIIRAMADGSNKEPLVTSGLGLPEDLAVDWLTKNIYFTDAEKKHIGVCNSDGTSCTVLINKNIRKPRAIVLNINNGDMYWSDWDKPAEIAYSYMDGTHVKSFVMDDIHWPNGLALDAPNERLYWTDARKKTLESINLDGTDRRIILEDIVKQPFAIAVFENRLYWSDWNTHSIQSCDKFTGKNHQTIVKEDKGFIYGLTIFHAAMEKRMDNPCSWSFCSDICLLSGSSYKCACPQNKVLGSDRHKCREVERKQMLILGAQNMLIHVEHQVLGGHKIYVVPAAVDEVGALAYNSVNNTLYVSDLGIKKILSVDLGTGMSKPLPIAGLGKIISMDYDPMGNNLYMCDELRQLVEVVNLNTMSKKNLLHDTAGEIPQSIALVPEEGIMFVALRKNSSSSHIDRFFMDGTGRTHSIDNGLSGSVSLHFDHHWYRILFADADSGKIESTSIEGDDRFEFRFLSTSPVGISSLNNDIFWVNEHSRRLYWAAKNSSTYFNQKITLDIAKDVKKMHLTAVTPRSRAYSACHTANGHCSHLCLMSQRKSVCACPIGMDLDKDNRTCLEHVECTPGEYLCYKSNHCIQKSLVCNGRVECTFGEDEDGCAPLKQCNKGEFQCQNGDCIKEEQVCDHNFDCRDKSDEFNCNRNQTKCPPAHFQCGDSHCIAESARCDSFKDCEDGSDEVNCITNTCDMTQFRCKSGGCIPKSWECNSEYDCVDMSDEHESCKYVECSLHMFTCRNNKCVDRTLTCDGQDDCGDNSDEETCELNKRSKCGPDGFACTSNSSICLLKSARCNGTSECPHHEDEKDCSGCLIDEFECDNKKCIAYQWLCDGTNDCQDNSDEKPAFCQNKKGGQANKDDLDAPCGGYRCKTGHCISMNLLCNGHHDCYDGSDEDGLCPTACSAGNSPCGQECLATPNGPACRCRAGYKLRGDEHTCVDIDECAEDPPRCSQLCRNHDGGHSCDCYVGYVLKHDKLACKALGDPMSLIYVAENQVRELDQKSNSLRVLFSEEMPKITGIEMSMRDKFIYLSLENSQTIQRLELKTKNRQYIEHVGQPEQIALDWSTNNIYYYNAQTNSKSINVCNFEAMLCARVIDIDMHRQVSSLAIDSVNKVLFYTVVSWWIFNTPSFVIYKINLDGTGSHELVSNSEGYVTSLTYDPDSKQLYYIDQHQRQISTIRYDGKMREVLFGNITKGAGIRFFENHLYYLMTNGYMGKCQLYQQRTCHHFQVHTYSSGLFLVNQEVLQPIVTNVCANHTCSYMCVSGESGSRCCICEDGTAVEQKDECPNIQRDSEKDARQFNFVKAPTTEKSKGSKMVTAFVISFFMIVIGVALVYYVRKRTNGTISMGSIRFINPTYNTPVDELDKPILIPGQHEYSNPVQTRKKSKPSPDALEKELQRELNSV